MQYANTLTQWLTYKPTDPANNLAASWHSYNFNICVTQTCWNNQIAPAAQQVPVVAGEVGENDCADGYINTLMPWMDSHSISYLGWTWDTWNCSSGPALISDYSGTPTNFGVGYQAHLAALGGTGATPTGTPIPPTGTAVPPTPTSTPANPASTSTPVPTPTPIKRHKK